VGELPPLVGVAVKVTLVPAQIIPEGLAAMLTEGVKLVVTLIVIAFDVAVAGEAQVALEVMITVTTSLLFSVVEVKVAPVPALVPFTCHW